MLAGNTKGAGYIYSRTYMSQTFKLFETFLKRKCFLRALLWCSLFILSQSYLKVPAQQPVLHKLYLEAQRPRS